MVKLFFRIYIGFLLCNLLNAQEKRYTYFSEIDSLFKKEDYKKIAEIDINSIDSASDLERGNTHMLIAEALDNINQENKAFPIYIKALTIFEELDDKEHAAKASLALYTLLHSQNNLEADASRYLKKLHTYARELNSKKWLASYYANYGVYKLDFNQNDSAKHYYKKAFALANDIDSTQMKVSLNINLGALFSWRYKNQDSAIAYYNSALETYYSDTTHYKDLNTEFNLFNNLGNAFRRNKDYDKALNIYQKAEAIDLPKLNRKSKKILYSNINATHYYKADYEEAYNYLYKYDSIKDIINLKEQNTFITEVEEKYDNEKLRADNLESEANRIKNQNIAIGLAGSLGLGSIIAFLLFKNTKRKQKLAEQEKAIETQKLTNVLKEQELMAIDAMIEGQEKERLRIANDLHDDLGGLMATVKLHLSSLKKHAPQDDFTRTNTLLDEAYQKIRQIAHTKNSGVIAKQGLLRAIRKMAKTISASNKLHIEVIDYGLDSRLENSLELSVFRMVQELVTNIIKHAEATEASIHLTQHETALNIMIEDNGKGFNTTTKLNENDGMGLHSIDKRVSHLDGTFTIESNPKEGTTIIIDIPI